MIPNRNNILKENFNYEKNKDKLFRVTDKSKMEENNNKNIDTNYVTDLYNNTVINNKNEAIDKKTLKVMSNENDNGKFFLI